jgi:class 3 adenylate cyclase
MPISIPKTRPFLAFSIIVDINGFALMVEKSEGNSIAQNVRDTLLGSVNSVERNGGIVVGFMGDAFLGFLETAEDVFKCCTGIAKDIDRLREYIYPERKHFPFDPKGPALKIGIEYGLIDVSTIHSNYLGAQNLFIGTPINYASRISGAGKGNRCNIGTKAFEMGLNAYSNIEGPFMVRGKRGEGKYEYKLGLGEIWKEGNSKESFWG